MFSDLLGVSRCLFELSASRLDIIRKKQVFLEICLKRDAELIKKVLFHPIVCSCHKIKFYLSSRNKI